MCPRCKVYEAVTKITMGAIDYHVCASCKRKLENPAVKLAEMFRTQNHVNRLWERA